jgi:hypothetical protein
MYLEEIGCKGKDWVLKMGSSNKFMWMWQSAFRFYEMQTHLLTSWAITGFPERDSVHEIICL